jgi:hypothetical protein
MEDNQRVAYTYTVNDDVIGLPKCKRHAVLGADSAAELDILPIQTVRYSHGKSI